MPADGSPVKSSPTQPRTQRNPGARQRLNALDASTRLQRGVAMSRFLMALLVLGLFALLRPAAPAADKEDPAKKETPPTPAWLKLTPDEFLERFDKNKDGVLTKDELPPGLARNFERYDRDGDGKLDKKEVRQMLEVAKRLFADQPAEKPSDKPAVDNAAVERRVTDVFERMDTNKDGKISKDEAKNFIAQAFDRIDTNKDGFIDKEELRRFVARNMAAGGGAAGGSAVVGGPDFDALDKDADGRLTRDELKGTPFFDKFDEIDTNKDGKIDKKEFAAYLKKQAEKKSP
jgi:Ca2+-binding EF-hand superfamily protein